MMKAAQKCCFFYSMTEMNKHKEKIIGSVHGSSLGYILDNLKCDYKKVIVILKNNNDLYEFLVQRIVSHLEEISLSKELVKAVCSSDELSQKRVLNIVDLKNRIKSIINFNKKDNFVEIKKVITRVSKLANKSDISRDVLSTSDYVNTKLFEKDCEFKVFEFIGELEKLSSEGYCNY